MSSHLVFLGFGKGLYVMSNTFRRAAIAAIAALSLTVSSVGLSSSIVAVAEPADASCCVSWSSKLELDNDGDGKFHKDIDAFLAGTAVELLPVVDGAAPSPTGVIVAHSNESGVFEFSDVPFGKYVARVVIPEGYVLSPAHSDWGKTNPAPEGTSGFAPENPEFKYAYSQVVEFAAGSTVDIPAPMFVPTVGKVFGAIWFETDGDGVREDTDATGSVPEVEVQLLRKESPDGQMKPIEEPWAVKKTSAKNGKFTFKHLPVGEYQLLYRAPDGFNFSADGADNHATRRADGGRLSEPFQVSASSKSVNMGAALTYSFAGDVFFDANGDSRRQVTERPAAKVRVELLSGDKVISTVETDTNGRYFFTDAPDGLYQVRVRAPKPWQAAATSHKRADAVTLDVEVFGNEVTGLQEVWLIPPDSKSTSAASDAFSVIDPPTEELHRELDFGYHPNNPPEKPAEIATITALWNIFGGGSNPSDVVFAPKIGLRSTLESWFRVMLCKLGITSNCH